MENDMTDAISRGANGTRISTPGTVTSSECPVCGTEEIIERDVHRFSARGIPSVWGYSLDGHRSVLDVHRCPHQDEAWHRYAEHLWGQLRRLPRLSALGEVLGKELEVVLEGRTLPRGGRLEDYV